MHPQFATSKKCFAHIYLNKENEGLRFKQCIIRNSNVVIKALICSLKFRQGMLYMAGNMKIMIKGRLEGF